MTDLPCARLAARDLTLAYERRTVSTDLSVAVPDGSFTAIIGPNACGKSTLLRALARVLRPRAGEVVLDGRALAEYRSKEVARVVGLLPQSSEAPDGITVSDLVSRGRFPHQRIVRQWTAEDDDAVWHALEATSTESLADRLVAELSGGQRQRVWVAMALAQQAEILLLDEPTTFLDIAHQIELLDLFTQLHRQGRTIVAVLHDLNHAARYATHLVVMKDGEVVASGAPSSIMTAELVREVFGLPCVVIDDPVSHTPLVVPATGDWDRGPGGGKAHTTVE
ncbi:ABC transporter ATP-binding protein [Georgenia satyanarayanai]|uniref:ABC transporter ATP-binding protein n=1 Tax=Georgenia satyanarayanai TaxID=860221 RepID=UPI00203F9D43|nr:ABC transporter ATP-binding protein [Georgenia satyanarayanai]MCM3660544.1 ABC transporter ATP-binding protein [Georgenia satyanarayanai]